MLKSNPSYLGIAGKNPALGPPKSALGLRPWADFGGPRAGFFPEFLGQGLDFLPEGGEAIRNAIAVVWSMAIVASTWSGGGRGRTAKRTVAKKPGLPPSFGPCHSAEWDRG